MKINRENYEAYFLDYLEKNLPPELVAELMVFLEQNPDLKSELESFDNIRLEPEEAVRFEGKKVLLKKYLKRTENISVENYEEMMVARLEGDLSSEQNEELNEFLAKNPAVKLEYNLLKHTFLIPLEIQFQDKESLKKKGIWVSYRKPIIFTLSAAASILLFLGLFFTFNRTDQNRIASGSYRFEIQKMNRHGFDGFANEISYRKAKTESSTANQFAIALLETGKEEMKRVEAPEMLVAKNIKSLENTQEISGFYISTKSLTNEAIAFATEPVEQEGSFFGRFISGFAGKILPERDQGKKSFLEVTVEGYNFLADRDVEVEKEMDKNGKVIAYNLKGDNINYSHKVKNPSSE
ncbi:MAG: hypothetical protein JW731_17240 [Bacteroidales bacterium]|nr:hypothetical protein [Bacteroidales bacterium]